ncbi:hypothetical protein EZJ58_0342 [Sodalis ligni]|uniref:Uncharacterized protein n=1 Tax=Sodalis ligni TaxID=2697027 RepID=A0A4R1N718_9GAMM|nr:hypothetical protein EZJ58_0342 [Sodalis ligni]
MLNFTQHLPVLRTTTAVCVLVFAMAATYCARRREHMALIVR